MKQWLKRKLKQFLCDHRNEKVKRQIRKVLHDFEHNDVTVEPGGSVDTLLYMKKWFHCNDCGLDTTWEYDFTK